MKRVNLIIMFAILFGLIAYDIPNVFAEERITTEVHNVFIATFDNGQFYGGMLHLDGDSYAPIAFVAGIGEEQTPTFEDMLPANGDTITATFELNERGYNNIMHAYSTEYGKMLDFSWRYLDDSDIGTIANVSTHDGITDGTVNGDYAQFNGFVTNGPMYLLKDADPTVQIGANGWIIQNGNLIRFVVGDKEENPNQIKPQVYMALMVR